MTERKTEMGMMTDAMKRLRGEVEALRKERGTLMQDLALGTTQLRDAVATMQAGFRKTHGDMARHAKAERKAFITKQKRTVAHLRKEFATDMAGAARAWHGTRA
jgi:peptidoglycan hydrolase CwlO-like protein